MVNSAKHWCVLPFFLHQIDIFFGEIDDIHQFFGSLTLFLMSQNQELNWLHTPKFIFSILRFKMLHLLPPMSKLTESNVIYTWFSKSLGFRRKLTVSSMNDIKSLIKSGTIVRLNYSFSFPRSNYFPTKKPIE